MYSDTFLPFLFRKEKKILDKNRNFCYNVLVAKTIRKKKIVKNVVFDDRSQRWLCIVWDGTFARHHKLPKTVMTEAQAKKISKSLGLGPA